MIKLPFALEPSTEKPPDILKIQKVSSSLSSSAPLSKSSFSVMNTMSYNTSLMIVMCIFVAHIMTVVAAPMETVDEQVENSMIARPDDLADLSVPWDALNTAALRKLLLQLDADERLGGRVGRSWPQAEPRGWGLRAMDGRLARQWRADKRQVRFRQCYFNPISCFRK